MKTRLLITYPSMKVTASSSHPFFLIIIIIIIIISISPIHESYPEMFAKNLTD